MRVQLAYFVPALLAASCGPSAATSGVDDAAADHHYAQAASDGGLPPRRAPDAAGVYSLGRDAEARVDAGSGLEAGSDGSAATGDGGTSTVTVAPGTRDPLSWPFSATSIWNMPIGNNAVYAAANIDVDGVNVPTAAQVVASGGNTETTPSREWTEMPGSDQNVIILHPESPAIPLLHTDEPGIDWGGNRCDTTDNTALYAAGIPWPESYVLPSDDGNDCAAVLLSDGHSVLQFQPATRCSGSSYATALLLMPSSTLDITGAGIQGSHGGSELSALGGTLRVGELTKTSGAPKHVLSMAISQMDKHYCRTDGKCWRWPAYVGAPASGVPSPGTEEYDYGVGDLTPSAANGSLQTGALLAINKNVDIASLGLETQPGEMMAWTLQNYGAYVNDSTGGGSDTAFDTEQGPDGNFVKNFEAMWSYSFTGYIFERTNNSYMPGGDPFLRDLQIVMKLLQVIDNNAPSSIGGGGTPLQPLAPPFQ